jgi:3-oxoadipate enol-lactonase
MAMTRPQQQATDEDGIPGRARTRWVSLPGRGRTCVRDIEGPPGAPTLILLHGWAVTADTNFWSAYAVLARYYRVVSFDHCGHGLGVRNGGRFTLEHCADDVAVIARELGIDRAVVVGYSMGGPIALLTHRRHPDLVSGLVLCATTFTFRWSLRERAVFRALAAAGLMARATPMHFVTRHAGAAVPPWMVFRASWPGIEHLLRHDWTHLIEAGRAIGHFDAREWIGDVEVPASVVVTLDDVVVPTRYQRELAAAIPQATVFDAKGGHLACVTAPCLFVPKLVTACASVTTAVGFASDVNPAA